MFINGSIACFPKARWRRTGLALALLAASGAGCKRPPAPTPEGGADDVKPGPVTVVIATAVRKPMESTVVVQGTLAPAQGGIAHVAPTVAGRLVSVQVREGDRVLAGQVIAVVDNRPQQAGAASAAAALQSSQALANEARLTERAAAADHESTLRVVTLSLQTAKLDRDSAIRTAENSVQAAETDLAKTKNGPRLQEIQQADEAVTQAQATRLRAHTELDRSNRLLTAGIAPQRQVDDAQAAVAVADSAYLSAKAQANLMHAGSRPEDITAAQIRVDGAKEALKLARSDGDMHVAQAEAVLKQTEMAKYAVSAKEADALASIAASRQKSSDLAAATATAGYGEVRAPFSGIVTKRVLNPGDMADTTSAIVEISKSRSLNMLASLPAAAGAKLGLEMPVRITTEDAPGVVMPGRIISIGQVDPSTNLLSVRIQVDQSAAGVRVGSFATGTIVLSKHANAIVVPKGAVVSKDDKTDAFVIGTDNVAHDKQVQIGSQDGSDIEITSGVAAGDRVAVLGSYELTDGAVVKEAEKADASDSGAEHAADDKSTSTEKKGASATESAPDTEEKKPGK